MVQPGAGRHGVVDVGHTFLIQHADRLVFRFSPDDWLTQSLQITTIASHAMAIDHHVLVCGFGHTGRNLCQLLAQQNISYIALDVNQRW